MTASVAQLPHSIPTVYNGRSFRSRFEANIAAQLDRDGYTWQYEPQSFLLANGEHYWPDFLLTREPDGRLCRTWVECRGYRTDKGEAQIEGFAAQLPPGELFMVLRVDGGIEWYPKADRTAEDARFAASREHWKSLRDRAYAAGNGPRFDQLCDEIAMLRRELRATPDNGPWRIILARLADRSQQRTLLVLPPAAVIEEAHGP